MPTGMKNMAETERKVKENSSKAFTSKEICRIIKLARKQQVASLRIGEFSVVFQESNLKTGAVKQPALSKKEVVESAPHQEVADSEKALSLTDKRVVEELRRTQLLMDDPLAFEEAEIDAVITGDSGGSEEYLEENY